MTKYFTCAETAKMIRKALKEAFPGVKFGIRSHTYAGGASINIGWTDGPNAAQVQAVAAHFEAAYFDGSIDYKGSIYHMIDGQQVHFGADFIHFNRDYSDASIQRAIAALYRQYASNFAGDTQAAPTSEDFRQGRLHGRAVPGMGDGFDYWGMQSQVSRILTKHSDRMKVEKSPTAAKVFATHDDNYSKTCGSGFSVVAVD